MSEMRRCEEIQGTRLRVIVRDSFVGSCPECPRISSHLLSRPTLRAALCVLLAASVACTQDDWPLSLQQAFRRGVQAQKAGRLEEAEKAFLAVLRQGGKAAFVYHNLGLVYVQRGDNRRAVIQFREALRVDPRFAASRLPLAVALGRTGDLEGQAGQLRALREVDPKEPEYAYLLARAYTRLSADYYARIPKLNPRSARFYQVVGETYLLQGRNDRALGALGRAAQADPSLPGVHLALAQVYIKLGKTVEARRELQQELVVMPGSALALGLLKQLDAVAAKPE